MSRFDNDCVLTCMCPQRLAPEIIRVNKAWITTERKNHHTERNHHHRNKCLISYRTTVDYAHAR
jgi:hypothetical protein